MNPQEIYQSKLKTLDEFLTLIRPKDSIATSIAAGQPRGLLNHLSQKQDLEEIKIFTGLISFPYPILMDPRVQVTSGYYGPIERMLNEAGANISYMPLSFVAFEGYVESIRSRVVMSTFSAMDADGYLSFGLNSEAAYGAIRSALRDPSRIVIAEVNPQMPVISGLKEFHDNKIHISELHAVVEVNQSVSEVPVAEASLVERQIAEHVEKLIQTGDTLQFGIGAIPNEVARLLSLTEKNDFGVHSELVSDGFLTLFESGKITNTNKGIHQGESLFTFALGSQKLYDWLDERNGKNNRRAIAAPVSYVNDPHIIAKNERMVSINSGFMVDFAGQVCSEAIGEKQYSGVGGQLSFVQGAFHSKGGRSILCIKSVVEIGGKRFSNIVESFPQGSLISTPRHYVQWIVTEYGAVNLYGLSDEERPYALIEIAHPEFRDQLMSEAKVRDQSVYHSKRGRYTNPIK